MSPSGWLRTLGPVGVTFALVFTTVPLTAFGAKMGRPIVFARQEAQEDSEGFRLRTTPTPWLKKPPRNLDTDLFVVAPDGTGLTRLTNTSNVEDDYPEWSPDGQQIAFTRRIGKRDPDIYLMDADGGNPLRLTRNDASDYQPTWSPDGRRIAYMSWDPQRPGMHLFVIEASGSGGPRRLTRACGDASPAWSPDGRFIAFARSVLEGCSSGNDEIFVVDLQTNRARRLTYNATNDWNPAWSPDGRWIVFERYDCLIDIPVPNAEGCIVGEDMELFMMGADGSDVRQLTDNDVDEYWPAWSPDGDWIVFSRQETSTDYDLNLYKMSADGGKAVRLTGSSHSDDRNPDW